MVEQGSFTQASQLLYISQPAISIQIKRMESALGTQLLQSTRDGVVLTEAGRILYESARVMLEHERLAERRIADLKTGTGGSLAIGVTPSGAFYEVSRALKSFRGRYPGVEISLQVDLVEMILSRLQAGTLDVAIDWEPVPEPDFDVMTLAKVDFGVTIAADHPLARGEYLTVDEFSSVPYLSLVSGMGKYNYVESLLFRAEIITSVAMRLPSIDALKRVVEAGLGVTMVSPFSVKREVEAGYLRFLPLNGFHLNRGLVRILKRGRECPPQVEKFTDAILGAMEV